LIPSGVRSASSVRPRRARTRIAFIRFEIGEEVSEGAALAPGEEVVHAVERIHEGVLLHDNIDEPGPAQELAERLLAHPIIRPERARDLGVTQPLIAQTLIARETFIYYTGRLIGTMGRWRRRLWETT
jgi:hypothetical protein